MSRTNDMTFAQTPEGGVMLRRAMEALRSGVPSRDAVQVLGCPQAHIETAFRKLLNEVSDNEESSGSRGMLVEGGFGTGKSHLFEYLKAVALEAGFVCSRVVISKETPLYDPVRLFRAAIDAAAVPGRRGSAIKELSLKIRFGTPQYEDLVEWSHRLNERFGALLYLWRHLQADPELTDRIGRFWEGDPVSVPVLRHYLRACSDPPSYQFSTIKTRALALQRFAFVSRLAKAAGYNGWVLLIDEVELIGRYSFRQRAGSYQEVARWLGVLPEPSLSGIATVLAITDDFKSAVLDVRDDRTLMPRALQESQRIDDISLAATASAGIRALSKSGISLRQLANDELKVLCEHLRTLHSTGYSWKAPQLPQSRGLQSTRIREYIKAWITEWDLKRLYPDIEVDIETHHAGVRYEVDETLSGSDNGEEA